METAKKEKAPPKHLKDVFMHTPPASSNDFTGFSPALTSDKNEAENLSDMMNATTSPHMK